MKVASKKLIEFLKNVTIDKKIPSLILNFKEEGLLVRLQSANVVSPAGLMKKEVFENYEAIGKLGFDNVTKLIAVLDSHTTVTLIKSDNKLRIIGEKGHDDRNLFAEEFIENHLEKDFPLEFDGGVDVSSDELNEINKSCVILGNSWVIVNSNGENIVLSTENDLGDKAERKVIGKYKQVKAKYGESLLDVLKCLTGKVNMSFESDKPIRITMKTDMYTIKYFIAPMVENEEATPEKTEEAPKQVEETQ